MSPAIAIIGMACRYPDADTPEALWENVLARRCAFRHLPEERLRIADYMPRKADDPDGLYPIEAAVLENYSFDRVRHRVPAAAFASADITHWLALDVASEALEDAGLHDVGDRRERTAVIVGNTLTGEFSRTGLLRLRWPYVRRRVEAALADEGFAPTRRADFLDRLEEAYKAPFPPPDEESLAGGLSNTIAGRICNHYDLRGGGFTVDGACASSLLAVASGCLRLVSGEVDLVLAGGVDLSLDPFELVGFARNGALSPTVMRVFDSRSDGFWPGEGCGFVVLMRAAEACDAGHQARAVIRGWGMSTDGQGGLTRPTVTGQMTALERAYHRAGYDAGTVPLFEAHGTGTAVGDPVEIGAIAAVRRAAEARYPAAVGSIKANIGHTKAAAGIAGLIKTVMALDRQILPAATACEEPHPAVLEHHDMVEVPQQSRLWPGDLPLRAGVSAMGFGGINVHVALEGTASSRRTAFTSAERALLVGDQDAELFVFCAPDRIALRAQIEALGVLGSRLSRAELPDAAAALAQRSKAGEERAIAIASSPGELAQRLSLLLQRLDTATGTAIDVTAGIAFGQGEAPRIVFLFPGQAAPAALGGGLWRRRFAEVERLYAEAEVPTSGDGTATEIAQPAIVTASLAGLLLLDKLGIAGSATVGHSLGELTALHWAGAWSMPQLLRLARGRGQIMAGHSSSGGAMALIGGSPAATRSLLDGADAVIACFNAPHEYVVAGADAAIAEILTRAQTRGIFARRLAVSHAFHSRFVAPASLAVADLVNAEPAAPLRGIVFSTVTGTRLRPDQDLGALLGSQITAPVRFSQAVAEAAAAADLMIEVGPGHGLTRIAGELAGPPAIALDAGGNSLKGLLFAAGAAFVLGAPARIGALFDDRFVRPFDLDRDRLFLANPCEAAPRSLIPLQRKPATPPPPAATKMPDYRRTSLDVLRALVAKRLDLAADAVEPRHRLLGDLHLNSIAVGQLVAEAARTLGLSPPAAPTNFAMATVSEVAEALELGALLPADNKGELPAGVASWVRVFASELVERPLDRPDKAEARTWRVFAPSGHPIAARLSRGAGGREDGVAICLPEQPGSEHLSLLLEGAHAAITSGDDTLIMIVQQRGGGASFARCLSLEDPRLRVRVVDLPFDHPNTGAWLAAEAVQAKPGYSEAHYDRLGVRRAPVLRALPDCEPARFLSADDVILVSGGARGIGCECVLALARRAGAKVAILGRSADHAPEVKANLARLHAAGIKAAYASADVTDRDAVNAAVARFEAELGPVTAVIHAAGINRPTPLMQLDLATLRETVAVKIDGARNLLAALDSARLRLFIAFSSIIARTGLPGEAHYALANDWLGRLVEDLAGRYPSCRCHVLEWSVWSGVGMAEKLGAVEALARQGVAALGVEDATTMFEALVSRSPIRPAAVVAGRFGDLPTVDLDRPCLPAHRFLEHMPVFYPGVELVAEADVAPASDPYLAEHALAATPLLPAVLGLEAMVQAAAAVAGGRRPRVLEGVEFRQPVTIGSGGCRLRVAALARAADHIETVLRCEATGFQSDHFRAMVRFDGPASRGNRVTPVAKGPVAEGPLALDPAELYERLLFHSGRFRRISGYSVLSATSCTAWIRPAEGERWFPTRVADDLILGDPGARDAALHALQACIPHRRVLPVAVGRIELGNLQPERPYSVHGMETARDDKRFTFDVEIRDLDGTLAERWEGLVLQEVEALPLPERWSLPLAGPFLERRLGDLFPDLGLRIGVADDGQSGLAPPSAAVIGRLLDDGRPVLRRPDGKPEAAGYVSASHSGPLTLAAAACIPIGCDIETIEPRSEPVWRDLLGPERFALARLAASEGAEAFARSATRVWTAAEALEKAGAAVAQAPLTLDRVEGDWMIFAAGGFTVASRVEAFDCAGHGPFAIAIAIRQPPVAAVQPFAKTCEPPTASAARGDPRPTYSYRHVVGFRDTNVVGNVYFVNHLEWQGRCREMFLRDKAPSVLDNLANGLALVTTKCSCEYLAELNAFDEVRVDMRLKALTTNHIELDFEYWRCKGGTEELVAMGEQEIACMSRLAAGPIPCPIPEPLELALRSYTAG